LRPSDATVWLFLTSPATFDRSWIAEVAALACVVRVCLLNNPSRPTGTDLSDAPAQVARCAHGPPVRICFRDFIIGRVVDVHCRADLRRLYADAIPSEIEGALEHDVTQRVDELPKAAERVVFVVFFIEARAVAFDDGDNPVICVRATDRRWRGGGSYRERRACVGIVEPGLIAIVDVARAVAAE
jgi:hypothetical protein